MLPRTDPRDIAEHRARLGERPRARESARTLRCPRGDLADWPPESCNLAAGADEAHQPLFVFIVRRFLNLSCSLFLSSIRLYM